MKPFALLDDDNVYMPEKDYKRLAKYSVLPNDLLITVVGTLGNVAIVPENIKGIFSCKSTVFRDSTIDPYYLLAYFNCKYGHDCLLRRQRGAVQTGLNKEDLKTIPVPIYSSKEHATIGDLIRNSLELSYKSKSLYGQAQDLLEKELGLDQLVLKKAKSYEASFSEIVGNGRADADHYQIQYKQIKNLIKNYSNGFQPLLQIVESISPNINPRKTPATSFKYVELSNINPILGIVDGYKIVSGISAPSRAKRRILIGEIIASAVVGSVDKAGIVDETKEGALASTGFFHFRTRGSSPYYLLLLVRSKIVKMQLLQEATGGILSAVPDRNLEKIIIPILSKTLQGKLSSLVKDSHQAKKESELLLGQAKKRVENLIEGVIEQ